MYISSEQEFLPPLFAMYTQLLEAGPGTWFLGPSIKENIGSHERNINIKILTTLRVEHENECRALSVPAEAAKSWNFPYKAANLLQLI